MTCVNEEVEVVDLTTNDDDDEIENKAVVVRKRNRKHQGGDIEVEVVTLSGGDEERDVIGTGNAKDSSTKKGSVTPGQSGGGQGIKAESGSPSESKSEEEARGPLVSFYSDDLCFVPLEDLRKLSDKVAARINTLLPKSSFPAPASKVSEYEVDVLMRNPHVTCNAMQSGFILYTDDLGEQRPVRSAHIWHKPTIEEAIQKGASCQVLPPGEVLTTYQFITAVLEQTLLIPLEEDVKPVPDEKNDGNGACQYNGYAAFIQAKTDEERQRVGAASAARLEKGVLEVNKEMRQAEAQRKEEQQRLVEKRKAEKEKELQALVIRGENRKTRASTGNLPQNQCFRYSPSEGAGTRSVRGSVPSSSGPSTPLTSSNGPQVGNLPTTSCRAPEPGLQTTPKSGRTSTPRRPLNERESIRNTLEALSPVGENQVGPSPNAVTDEWGRDDGYFGGDKWEVEKIIGDLMFDGDARTRAGLRYLIKWKHWGPEFNSWVPRNDACCPELEMEYWQAKVNTIQKLNQPIIRNAANN